MRRWVLAAALAAWTAGNVAAAPAVESGAADRTAMEVTVYNGDFGLIKETRRLSLPEGRGELRFMDVASRVRPPTVQVRATEDPGAFSVLEQNYAYDLLSPEKLLDKYVGRKIKIVQWNDYKDRKDAVDAVLLSNNGGPIYKIGDEFYLGHPGIKVLPALPEDLIVRPTLSWLYESKGAKAKTLEVSYLADQITWRADYVLSLAKDDASADLTGWVTVDNRSGATYRDAGLKLVAGTVNRASEPAMDYAEGGFRAMKAMAAPAFQEQALFDYHAYDLARRTTIKDNEAKQIRLLEGAGVAVKKEYVTTGQAGYVTGRFPDRIPKQPVDVSVSFRNASSNRLGAPLPMGVVRIYKKDADGRAQFLGEDRVAHTPKDEEVRLKVGEAFDIAAERAQTDFRQITSNQYETEWEITLRNRKDEDVVVDVVEPVLGHWQVTENSHPFKKVDASTLRFDVAVPKDKEVKVKYRIRVGL